jgi:hypothetical protein
MKGLLDFSLLLFCFSQAVRAQGVVCIQAITTTIPYVPALTLSNDACPTDSAQGIEYNKVGTYGFVFTHDLAPFPRLTDHK